MKLTWSRAHTVVAGTLLIVISNAVALIGVSYNRSGDPESQLKLSQRELWQPFRYGLDEERGGIVLDLRWRVLTEELGGMYYGDNYGAPLWLDKAKLASLGFDVSRGPDMPAGRRYHEKQLPKEVMVVLEFDGPAYQKALVRARARAEADQLRREETINSRLFAVDAGLDAVLLREKYPDRTRYAIVRGSVRLQFEGNRTGDAQLTGHITDLHNHRVSVPHEFRDAIVALPRASMYGSAAENVPPFQATVAFGRRLEPWIIAASSGQHDGVK